MILTMRSHFIRLQTLKLLLFTNLLICLFYPSSFKFVQVRSLLTVFYIQFRSLSILLSQKGFTKFKINFYATCIKSQQKSQINDLT